MRPSATNFKSFSRSLEQFFLTVGQTNFGNKIPFAKFSSTHKSFFKLLCSVISWRFCTKNWEMGDMIDFYLFLNSQLYKILWEISAPRSLWSFKTFPQDFALLTLDYGIDKWSEINITLRHSHCARTDLNIRFLPKPMTITGWKAETIGETNVLSFS